MKCIALVWVVLATMAPASLCAQSDDYQEKSRFGLKGGWFGGTEVTAVHKETGSEYTLETETGVTAGIFFDFPVHRYVLLGIAVNMAVVKPEGGLQDAIDSEYLLNGSGVAKLNLRTSPRFALRPGFEVGYATLSEIGLIGTSQYVTLRLFGEMVVAIDEQHSAVVDLGYFTTISGSSSNYDIDDDGLMVFRLGLSF